MAAEQGSQRAVDDLGPLEKHLLQLVADAAQRVSRPHGRDSKSGGSAIQERPRHTAKPGLTR